MTGDAQGVALLAQQRIAAIAGTEGLDGELLREVHDEAAVGVQLAGGMQALHEVTFALDARQCRRAHAGHDPHIGHHVGRIGDFHTAARQGRINRAHAIGNDIQRAATHAAVKQCIDLGVRFTRGHPMIVGAGVFALGRADEGEMLHARHIVGMGAMQGAARMGVLIEFDQGTVSQHVCLERGAFGIAAIAPVDGIGLGQLGDIGHPLVQGFKLAGHWRRFPALCGLVYWIEIVCRKMPSAPLVRKVWLQVEGIKVAIMCEI